MNHRLLLCAVLGILAACEEEATNATCAAPAQGVSGAVMWLEGNHMPSDGAHSDGSAEGLSTTVAAFDVITEADATEDTSDPEAYGRFDFGDVAPVASTVSGEDGCFSLELEEGDYTIVADDGGAWFCNNFNSDGLCVVSVSAGGAVAFNVNIDYRAAY